MKTFFLGLAFLSTDAVALERDSWFNPFPGKFSLRNQSPVVEIPADQFFEVSSSKEALAEADLSNIPVRSLNMGDIKFWGFSAFTCRAPASPYLVRAIYENGGTGKFNLTSYGSALLIVHSSLGKSTGMHRTALVACLGSNSPPNAIYHAVEGAM